MSASEHLPGYARAPPDDRDVGGCVRSDSAGVIELKGELAFEEIQGLVAVMAVERIPHTSG